MIFELPTLFSDAVRMLRGKRLLPTDMSSAELRRLAAATRRRAIFSARNTQISVLQRVKDVVDKMLEGAANLADGKLELARALDEAGYRAETGFPGDEGVGIPPAEKGSLRDLRSEQRRELVVRTQVRLASNEAFMARGMGEQRRYEWPALELVRYEERQVPRGKKRSKEGLVDDPGQGWPARWVAAGGELFDGRMIAAKDSPVWQALGDGAGGYEDTLGNPFAPFAYGSGYGVREIRRDEALALGVISASDKVAKLPPKLAADLRRDAEDLDPALLEAFEKDLETREDGSVRMRRILEAEVAAREAAYGSYAANTLQGRCRLLLNFMQGRVAA